MFLFNNGQYFQVPAFTWRENLVPESWNVSRVATQVVENDWDDEKHREGQIKRLEKNRKSDLLYQFK